MSDKQAMYKALVKDIRENFLDICGACVQAQLACAGKEDMECDTCKEECLCRCCRNCDHWKWKGESEFEVSAEALPLFGNK